jgi:hypothetical protein
MREFAVGVFDFEGASDVEEAMMERGGGCWR